MFDGDQFHQFIASSRSSLPINPLSFSLHGNPSFSAAFEPYPSSLPQLHHQEPPPTTTTTTTRTSKNNIIDQKHVEKYSLISTNLGLESERSMDPWSNDEVLALLKVRSSMEIWLPDFTWEHVSRKLAELGFKRSADECKDKFEEESRQFNSVKSYRIFGDFDEFYTADHQVEARNSAGKSSDQNADQERVHNDVEENSTNPIQESEQVAKAPLKSSKKRKRKDKFEMFKGFCEAVVKKMMAQQEEMHNKLIDDIVKRDDEKIAREEAWQNQEMNRIKLEIETRTKEQANAAERQATIIEFLKKFTSDQDQNLKNKIDCLVNTTTSNSCRTPQTEKNPSSSLSQNSPKPTKITPSSPSSVLATKNPKPNTALLPPSVDQTTINESTTPPSTSMFDSSKSYETGSDIGKRWPREEVLALINLRCKMSSNNDDCKEPTKGPLWERISQGMTELGYKRNAKRCKEKWENINKYFRKTKDSSKKRSVNSRTCPYFHQLSCLYSEGTIVAPNNMQENQ